MGEARRRRERAEELRALPPLKRWWSQYRDWWKRTEAYLAERGWFDD